MVKRPNKKTIKRRRKGGFWPFDKSDPNKPTGSWWPSSFLFDNKTTDATSQPIKPVEPEVVKPEVEEPAVVKPAVEEPAVEKKDGLNDSNTSHRLGGKSRRRRKKKHGSRKHAR